VFLELGFAWAKDKPTILIAKEGGQLPFDVRGQRCIMYSSIADLRKKLTNELANLKKSGVFAQKIV
jgi:nucleoside 2-deoxyribosyltransferase